MVPPPLKWHYGWSSLLFSWKPCNPPPPLLRREMVTRPLARGWDGQFSSVNVIYCIIIAVGLFWTSALSLDTALSLNFLLCFLLMPIKLSIFSQSGRQKRLFNFKAQGGPLRCLKSNLLSIGVLDKVSYLKFSFKHNEFAIVVFFKGATWGLYYHFWFVC